MATKKKGNLTISPEWARHLRPTMKRWFWKGERSAEAEHIESEARSQFIHSVEELLKEIDLWDSEVEQQQLSIAVPMEYEGNTLQSDIAMSIVLDKALEKGYLPNGVKKHSYGATYFYIKESVTNA